MRSKSSVRVRALRSLTASLVVLVAVVAMRSVRGDDRALVPESSDAWRDRLRRALAALEAGDHRGAIDGLQPALREGRGVVVQVGRRPMTVLEDLRAGLDEPSAEAVRPAADQPDEEEIRRMIRNHGITGVPIGAGRSEVDLPGVANSYLEVATVARWVLDRAPDELAKLYRARYELGAAELLERATLEDDPTALRLLADSYPITAAGLAARERLADDAYLAGRLREAYVAYQELLEAPVVPVDVGTSEGLGPRGRVGRKLLACAGRLGGRSLLEVHRGRVAARLGDEAPDSAEWSRLERLANDFERAPEIEPEEHDLGVPSRWGGELRAVGHPRVPAMQVERSWESSGWSAGVVIARDDFDSFRGSRFSAFGRGVSQGVDHPFVPLVLGDRVLVSGVRALYWLDGRPGAGKILREAQKPAAVTRGVRGGIQEASDSPLYAVTAWDRERDEGGWTTALPRRLLIAHYALTNIPSQQFMGFDVTVSTLMRSLVAYDASTGRTVWRTRDFRAVTQRDPFGPNQVPVEISYTSPAVVRDGLVFVSGWRDEGYVNALVRALDVATGELVWETPIGSSQMEPTMFGEIAREPFASFIVEREGVLYCSSSLGVVAAIESRSGRLLWSTAYDYIVPEPTMQRQAKLRSLSWGANPPLLVGHLLIVAPRDSRSIFAIDTGTGPHGAVRAGCVLWSYEDVDGDLRDLLGYRRGRLYFTGPAGVAALDVSGLEASGELSAGDSRAARSRRDPEQPPSPERLVPRYAGVIEDIPAAGLLTREGVVFCDESSIGLVDLDLEERRVLLEEFPPSLDGIDAAGRVLVAGELLITVSDRKISAFGGVRP